jgi:hypothetical protein
LIDTDGRSGRFLTRAQNRAITIESAPRSSKKLLSTDTCSTLMTSASTSAKALSVVDSEEARLTCAVEESVSTSAELLSWGESERARLPGVVGASTGTSAKAPSVLKFSGLGSNRARLAYVVGESARATVKVPRASCTL